MTKERRHEVRVDPARCVGCGLCAEDCVAHNLVLREGKAEVLRPQCIYCGHCEAICPQNAVTLTGFADRPEEFSEQTRLDPETLLQAIRTRRTVRRFQDRPVPEAVREQIIEAGRLAPTGSNRQNVSYLILDRKKEELEAMAVAAFRAEARKDTPLSRYLRGMAIDDRFFFKGAPLVILALSDDPVNASLAAENMAFMAEAHGLGVLFSGLFTYCANLDPALGAALGLSPERRAVMTLVMGYPAVRYHRTVRREPADVTIL